MVLFQVIGDGILTMECNFPYRQTNQQLHHHCLKLSDVAAQLTAMTGDAHAKRMDLIAHLHVENVEGPVVLILPDQILTLRVTMMNNK